MNRRRKAQIKRPLAERMAERERIRGKRTAKDSVFTHLFGYAEYRFLLFRALHPEMTDIRPSDKYR